MTYPRARESWIACSLLATCLGAAGARAQPPAPHACAARSELAEAQALARESSYIAAMAAIDEGLACAPGDIDLLQLRARMALDRLDFAGALAAYEALLEAGLRGADRRKVLDILRTLRAARSTRVAITVNVPADVYLGARELGKACDAEATCTLSLLPGNKYRVLIERPGFEPAQHVVRPRQGETVTITQELEELPSPLSLAVTPADAVVTLDGEVWQPGTPRELAAGEHQVRAWREGYFVHEASITARLGEPVAIAIDLDERVPIRVSPAGARVLPVPIGGQEVALVERTAPLWPTLGAGSATLAGLGVAVFQSVRAQQHMNRALALCSRAENGGLSCPDSGEAALAAAERASTRGNLALAVSAALAVGTLYAWTAAEPTHSDGMSMRRKLAIGTSGGVAASGLAIGIWYGLQARSLRGQAQAWCDDAGRCDPAGLVLLHEARNATGTANLGFAVAGVAAAGAALLWWQTPDGGESRLTIAPVAGDGQVGVGISGRY
jgi:hypothetical protein